jgi:hypothetical protein
MNYEQIGAIKKAGRVNEQVLRVTKNEGHITMKDIENIKRKWIDNGKKKYKAVNIDMIKVLSGRWMTFSDEAAFNKYFETSVRDPS